VQPQRQTGLAITQLRLPPLWTLPLVNLNLRGLFRTLRWFEGGLWTASRMGEARLKVELLVFWTRATPVLEVPEAQKDGL
jgi:hypothetical protein